MKMKKILVLGIVVWCSLVLYSGFAYAIQGVCSNCHTMHNSQNGAGEVQTYANGVITYNVATPLPQLLKADCIACHAGDGNATNSFNAPIVVHISSAPTGQGGGHTLAGGDFWWVADGLGDCATKGHNVLGLAASDGLIPANTPPGWHPDATPGALGDGLIALGGSWTQQLTCAGLYGCHGSHSANATDPMAGIRGAHHGNTGLTSTKAENPTTVGGSYRFLGGINGLENADWNWNEAPGTHNEYYGVDDTATRLYPTYFTYANKRTISYSCAECHGFFHSQIDDSITGSPWLRHPTDIDLPATSEYASYNPDNGNVYSLEAPVARGTVPGSSSSTVTPGDGTGTTGAIVMCLSCHRAHGSPEPDILRWTYSDMQAGTGTIDTGCFTCHTTKNAD
jgi:predicted CXXCH cytochrome family protein